MQFLSDVNYSFQKGCIFTGYVRLRVPQLLVGKHVLQLTIDANIFFMNSILRNLRILLVLLAIGGCYNSANATHIAGGEITYKALNDTDYLVTLTIYRDCQATVNIGNGSQRVNLFHSQSCATVPGSSYGTFYSHPFSTHFLPLTNIGGTEVSQLCAEVADSSACSSQAAKRKYAGLEKFVYEGTITIPFKCNSWYVAHYFNARSASMNVENPNGSYQDTNRVPPIAPLNGRPFYIEVKINNDYTFASGNSSPIFTADPIPYFCKDLVSTYNYSVIDADGDSLSYSLVPGSYIQNKSGNSVFTDTNIINFRQAFLNYRQPEYTSSQPLHDAVINPVTGNITFKQRVKGRYVVVLKVTEYDKNNPDSIKSEMVRDIQFQIDACSGNSAPELVSGGIHSVTGGLKVDSLTVKTLATSNLCFKTSFQDADAGDTITTSNNRLVALVGATESITGVNADTTEICWTPPANPLSNYTLTFTSKDDNCPVKAATSVAVRIQIEEPISNATLTPTKESCNGESDGRFTASFEGGIGPFGYYWIKDGTDTLRLDTNVLTNVSSANSYSVVITDSFNMASVQSVGQNLPPTFPVRVVANLVTDIDCDGGCTGKIEITSVTGGNTSTPGVNGYFFKWNNSNDTIATADSLCAGSHLVTVSDDNGCDTVEQFFVSQKPVIGVVITDSTDISCKGGRDGEAESSARTLECGVYPNLAVKCATTDSITIGSGNASNGFTGYPTPFAASLNAKQQYLYLASELKAAGFTKGRISKIKFQLQGSFVSSFTDYEFAIGCTDSTDLASGFINGGFQVYSANSHGFTPNDLISLEPAIEFSKEFEWDGNSNIIIQICNSKSATFNSQVKHTVTAFTSVAYHTENALSACLSDTSSVETNTRPNIEFHFCEPGINYSWNSTPVQTDSTADNLPAGTFVVTASNLAGCEAKDTVTLTEPPVGLVLGTTVLNTIDCAGDNDGSASVEVTGGSPGFMFAWPLGVNTQVGMDSVAINLEGGVKYIVTVTDSKGCEDTISIELTEPTAITFGSSAVVDADCKGSNTGEITVVPSGGTAPFSNTYVWDPVATGTTANVTNLVAGTYRVTAEDANGCQEDTLFTVGEPTDTLTFGNSTQLDVTCKGASTGSINVVLSGGTTPYSNTYVWDPVATGTTANVTNLAAGTYRVTAEDANGCEGDTTFTITEPATGVTFGSSTVTDVLCKDSATGEITVVPAGGTLPYTNFRWSAGGSTTATASNLVDGSYTVTVEDGSGCDYDTTFIITEPATAIALSTTIITPLACNAATNGSVSVQVTGGTPGYGFAWPLGVVTQVGMDSVATNLAAGTRYIVTVTDGNGGSDTETIGITCNLNQDEVLSTILEDSRASQGGVGINGQTPIATLDSGEDQRLAVFNHNSPINVSGFNSNPDSTNSTSANVAHKLPLYTSSSDLAQDIASLEVNGAPLEIVKEGIVQDITCVDNANGLDCSITGSGFEIGSKVDLLTCDGEEIPLSGTEDNVSTFGYSTSDQIRANFNNGETTLENCVAKNGDLENLLNGSIRVTITEAQGPEINGTISSTITNEDGSIPEYALTSASITLEDGVTYMLTKNDGVSSEANFDELHSVIDANEISYSVRAQDSNGNVSNESLGSYDVTQVTLSSDGGEFDGSSTEVTQGDDAQVYILAPTYSVGSNDSNKLSVGLEAKLNGSSSSNVRVDGEDVIVDTSDLDVGSYVISVDGIASCDTQQYSAQQCNSDFEEV